MDKIKTTEGDLIVRDARFVLVASRFNDFVVESRIEKVVVDTNTSDEVLDGVMGKLKVVPRYGLLVLVIVFGSMMYAARGF